MKPRRPPSKADVRASLRGLSAMATDQGKAAAADASLALDKPDRTRSKAPASVPARASEAQVLNAVLGLLRRHPAVAMCWRNNVGAAEFGDQWVRFGFPGLSDISFILRGGRAGFIECKREHGGRLSEAQEAFLTKARAAGCIAGVVRSVDEAALLIKYALTAPAARE